MVSLILAQRYKPATLLLIEEFANAKKISASKDLGDRFVEVRAFTSKKSALKFAASANPDRLFIDSDIGLKRHLQLLILKGWRPKCSIEIYEEGIGTYRTDLMSSRIGAYFRKSVGAASFFGDSVFTNKVHIFDVGSYQKALPHLAKKAIPLPHFLADWLEMNEATLSRIFCVEKKLPLGDGSRAALLFLSDWGLDSCVLAGLRGQTNVYIKPHPHIAIERINQLMDEFPDFLWMPSEAPAELVIVKISRHHHELNVIHTGSSAAHYLRDRPRIRFELHSRYAELNSAK